MLCRHESDSETSSTDLELGWRGLGAFEYSQKGLPHAVVHATEELMCAGHFAGYDTGSVEAAHKVSIKKASTYGRTYANRNTTQLHMLQWVLEHKLWDAVVKINIPQTANASHQPTSEVDLTVSSTESPQFKFFDSLPLTRSWNSICYTSRRREWHSDLLSKRVLITRKELVSQLLLSQLTLEVTSENIQIIETLKWVFHGSLSVKSSQQRTERFRKFVGISFISPGRRDFVRLRGFEDNTVLSAQVPLCD